MATVATRHPSMTAPASREREPFQPFRDFVGPGRRRTDHPLVVGTIVLCLGITTLTSIIQIAATVWAGSQVKAWMDGQHEKDHQTEKVRMALFRNTEASNIVLRRLCLNTAKTDKDQQECLSLAPPMPSPDAQGGPR